MAIDYKSLRVQALANFEPLLNLWNIDWKKISDYEYDFKNPTRNDQNFGACRFNILKNIGSDFALPTFTEADYAILGAGFNKNDFSHQTIDYREQSTGFDIIGLVQRFNKLDTYREAAELLRKQLIILNNKGELGNTNEAIKAREDTLARQRLFKIKKSSTVWGYCVPVKGTVGENYLTARCIEDTIDEPNMRFHHKVKNKELDKFLPAILFKVTTSPETELVALHRIYLTKDGHKKAELENPKMVLGSFKGAGIWFGKPGPKLYVAEGPENALSLRQVGCEFVVSTISASNFGNLVIPEYVEIVILARDNDTAGHDNAVKAARSYVVDQKKVAKILAPRKGEDWNSALIKDRGASNGQVS